MVEYVLNPFSRVSQALCAKSCGILPIFRASLRHSRNHINILAYAVISRQDMHNGANIRLTTALNSRIIAICR